SLELLHALTASTQVPSAVIQTLVHHTQGHPLFLEELLRFVTGHPASGCTVALPNTLPEVIAARMAQLTPASRRLLQTAAVLGPACVQPALQALWQGQEVLIPLLQELQRQAFYPSQTSSPEPAYSFTHALRWEVAYASLAAPARQILHRAAAQML